MMQQEKRDQQDIWFRNPMVWFIITLPAAVVIACILTIVIAYKNAPTVAKQTDWSSANAIHHRQAAAPKTHLS